MTSSKNYEKKIQDAFRIVMNEITVARAQAIYKLSISGYILLGNQGIMLFCHSGASTPSVPKRYLYNFLVKVKPYKI
jgi:hypothetical protein